MKVVHLIPWLKTGGSEFLLKRHVAEILTNYPEVQSEVWVLGSAADSESALVRSMPVPPRFLNLRIDYRHPLQLIRGSRSLAQALRDAGAALVHSYLMPADVFAAIAAVRARIPHIAHVLDRRGSRNTGPWRHRVRVRILGALLRRSGARLAAVSNACAGHAHEQYQVGMDRIVVAPNGINVDAFLGESRASTGVVRIGAISRVAAEKGLNYLLEAGKQLLDQGVNCRLLVAGPGSDSATMRDTVRAAGLEQHCELLGRVPDVAAFYRGIDIFVIASVDSEGLPTTILEAMASGLPVVATDVGGAREAITDGETGLLVLPEQSTALASAIRRLVENPELGRNLGRCASRRVRDVFTTRMMTATIVEKVYRATLQEGSAK